MTTHREIDPEGDPADAGQLREPACKWCGGPLDLDGECADPLCPGSEDEDEDEELDFEEGLLGECDDDGELDA